VHAICAALAKGAFVPEGMIGEELLGYVQSFQKWAEIQVKSFLVIEKRYSDDDKGYTGQLDFVILAKDDKLYLADLKTSARPQKTYPVQMAAYEYLIEKNKIQVEGAMLVYLDKEGDFPDIHLIDDLTKEREVFFSALDCYHYFNKGKRNGTDATTDD